MKNCKRHLIAFLLILALSAACELIIFNGDTLFRSYGSLRYCISDDKGMNIRMTEQITPLSDDEQNEIRVHQDNERILAEYRGEEYTPVYDENIVVNEDGSLSRRIKRTDISLDLNNIYYIKKLKLETDLDKTGGYTVTAYLNGEAAADDMYCSINPKIDAGVMNVGEKADFLEIVLLTEDELNEDDICVEISSQTRFHFLRALFFAVSFSAFYVMLLSGRFVYDFIRKKPEWIFAIFTLLLGSLIIEGLGSNMVSYDEYAHAKSAYKLSFGTTIETTEAAMQMVGNNLPYFNNPEERELVEAYEDRMNDPNIIAPDIGHQTWLPRTENRVYYPMAAGFYLGRLLHIGFADTIGLARFFNLLCYIFIVFWAVKKAKGYSMVVAAIGMLPNNIFIVSSLSYDMLVNACLLLGYVLVLNEFLEPEERLKPGNAFLMLFSFMVGCLSKPVYIVMSLMLLFLPKEKFQNRFSEIIFKLALIGLNGFMLYNIFCPTPVAGGDYELVSNAAYSGDKRNIGTSTMGQLAFIMENPLTYVKILCRSMVIMLSNYTVNRHPYLTYAYLGEAHYLMNWVMVFLGFFAALFADVKSSVGKLRGALTHLMNFGVVVIVFSSMYISYTAVGSETILGVQGRYVIPLFLPFLSCFIGWGIKRERDGKQGWIVSVRGRLQDLPAVYERIIFSVMLAVNLWMTLRLVILKLNV